MTTLAVSEARKELADVVDRVKYKGERFILSKNGKRAAAIISVEDLDLLEGLQDIRDTEEAERRLSDPGQKPVPFKRTTGVKGGQRSASGKVG
jgi:prevent-host-death family protein